MRVALFLVLASLAHADDKVPNARVVFQVASQGASQGARKNAPPARWELWSAPQRAHLRAPDREIFWDLEKERRLDVRSGRSRDEPISFGKTVRTDELFPRGLRLKRLASSKILGRSCQLWRHQQSDITATGATRNARMTWCVWKGLPIGLEVVESVCQAQKCVNVTLLWKAVEIALGAAQDADLNRPTASGTPPR